MDSNGAALKTQRNKPRGLELIHLLHQHGPLSYGAISRMIEPKMRRKKLKEALLRLRRKEVVATRHVGEIKVFYHLSQQLKNRVRLAKILKCQPADLIQPIFRQRDWIHSEACEYWIFILKRLFKNVEVIREIEFSRNELAKNIMLIQNDDFELRPDFLLIFPASGDGHHISVAVEIERSRKSNRRLIQKLHNYTNKCHVDGLIYVCDSDRLRETIRLVYENKVLAKATRIRHYGNNFLLLSDAINPHNSPTDHFFNVRNERVSLIEWTAYLGSKRRNFRRDFEFPLKGPLAPTPQINSTN